MDPMADDMNITMSYSAPDMHMPDIERNNCVVKERFRIAYYRLPYKKIPRIMIQYFAMVCVRQLNLFPAKNGISSHYSPHMIIHGRILNTRSIVCVTLAHMFRETSRPQTRIQKEQWMRSI